LGVLGALWLYAKRNRDQTRRQEEDQHEALFRQLRAEFDANLRIIRRSLTSIKPMIDAGISSEDPNDPIYDEQFYLAPMFNESWEALTRTDAHRVLEPARLEQLFGYYAAVARVNWLLSRVQRFRYRVPILQEIQKTLAEVQEEIGGTVDFDALQSELAGTRRGRGRA
jgi:hypothetical protein